MKKTVITAKDTIQQNLHHGLINEAEKVRHDSLKFIENSGFREYFDPTSGEGLGGDSFTWTAAIYLIFNAA